MATTRKRQRRRRGSVRRPLRRPRTGARKSTGKWRRNAKR